MMNYGKLLIGIATATAANIALGYGIGIACDKVTHLIFDKLEERSERLREIEELEEEFGVKIVAWQ